MRLFFFLSLNLSLFQGKIKFWLIFKKLLKKNKNSESLSTFSNYECLQVKKYKICSQCGRKLTKKLLKMLRVLRGKLTLVSPWRIFNTSLRKWRLHLIRYCKFFRGDPKVYFPRRTLNKFKHFLFAELPEPFIAEFVSFNLKDFSLENVDKLSEVFIKKLFFEKKIKILIQEKSYMSLNFALMS